MSILVSSLEARPCSRDTVSSLSVDKAFKGKGAGLRLGNELGVRAWLMKIEVLG